MSRRNQRLALFVVCVALAGAVLPFVASADHVSVTDTNDARGPFDVRRVRVEGIRSPRYDVVTFDRWTVAQVWDRSFGLLYFDTMGGAAPDYHVLVRSDGYRMRATLYRDRARKRDRAIGPVKAWRPGKRSFAVRVPLRKMSFPAQRLVYYWWVQTLHTGASCKRVCFDRAPDAERVAEPVPGAEPTSPAPSLTPPLTPLPSPSVTGL